MATEKVVLVFGGSGVIGSGIIKALLKCEKGTVCLNTRTRSYVSII